MTRLILGHAVRRELLGGAQAAMAECDVDLLLSGDLHITHTAVTASRYKLTGHSALIVQAGTAISTRGRCEANSFDCLRIGHGRIGVEQILLNLGPQYLTLGDASHFQRTAAGWESRDPASRVRRAESSTGRTLS